MKRPFGINDGSLVRSIKRGLVVGGCFLLLVQIEGCYYMQAARGQMGLMNKRRPIVEVIADDESSEELKARLTMVSDARAFSIDELQLPDNSSYRSYADLERDYVVWNVFAAPEFSLAPKRWCYPVAGCVAYRGYFAEDAANKHAQKLIEQGYDTTVGGVAAYSTLGRFSDPVLNTMMRWSDVELVATLFHELAHQKLYVKGDTAFNESFATAVADIGLEKWLAKKGQSDQLDARQTRAGLRRDVLSLIDEAKVQLEALYSSDLEPPNMRAQKTEILQGLSEDIQRAIADAGGSSSGWMSGPLNNARLASLGLYEGHVAAFRSVYAECDNDLACFYEQAAAIAGMTDVERIRRLEQLGAVLSTGANAPSW